MSKRPKSQSKVASGKKGQQAAAKCVGIQAMIDRQAVKRGEKPPSKKGERLDEKDVHGLSWEATTELITEPTTDQKTESPTDVENMLFADRFKPVNLSRIVGNEKLVPELDAWARGRHDDPWIGFQLLVITGPPGCGKSLFAHLLLKELKYRVVEYNCSDVEESSSSSTKKSTTSLTVDSLYRSCGAVHDITALPSFGGDAKGPIEKKKKAPFGVVLEDIDKWPKFSFTAFKKLLVLHKDSAVKAVKKRREQLKAARKKEEEKKKKPRKARATTTTTKKKKKNPFGLPEQYPRPILCPMIATASPDFATNLKTQALAEHCKIVRLNALSTSDMRAILEQTIDLVCAEDHVDRPPPISTQLELVEASNGDARKLLNLLQFAWLRKKSDAVDQAKSNTSKMKCKEVMSSDSCPDVWKTCKEVLQAPELGSPPPTLTSILQLCTALPELGDYTHENYLRLLEATERGKLGLMKVLGGLSQDKLVFVSDLMSTADCIEHDNFDELKSYEGVSSECAASMNCWGTRLAFSGTGARTSTVSFPQSYGSQSRTKGRRNEGQRLQVSVNRALATLPFADAQDWSEYFCLIVGKCKDAGRSHQLRRFYELIDSKELKALATLTPVNSAAVNSAAERDVRLLKLMDQKTGKFTFPARNSELEEGEEHKDRVCHFCCEWCSAGSEAVVNVKVKSESQAKGKKGQGQAQATQSEAVLTQRWTFRGTWTSDSPIAAGDKDMVNACDSCEKQSQLVDQSSGRGVLRKKQLDVLGCKFNVRSFDRVSGAEVCV